MAVLDNLLPIENKWTLITLDIDPLHSPEILIDLADLTDLSSQRLPLMDAIVCIEVFDHVHRIAEAINGIKFRLAPNGKLIASTPWIIPMHDRPNDFRRFTYEGIESLLREFGEIKIIARGNYLDSVNFFTGLSKLESDLYSFNLHAVFLSK